MSSKTLQTLSRAYAFALNPLLNVPILFWIDPAYDNLTHIGNTLDHRLFLMVWAVSSVIGMYFFAKRIWSRYHVSYSHGLHALVCLGMPLSCIIPYSNGLPGFVNDLHVWLAVVCVCLYMAEWIRTMFDPVYTTSPAYHALCVFLLAVFALSFLCMAAAGHVNALCEMAFSVLVNMVLAVFAWPKKKRSPV